MTGRGILLFWVHLMNDNVRNRKLGGQHNLLSKNDVRGMLAGHAYIDPFTASGMYSLHI